MTSYEQVIRQVRYFHRRPARLTERRFRLTCSELNGRYTSNELNLEVSVAMARPLKTQHLHVSLATVTSVPSPPAQVSVLHGSEPGEQVGHAIAPPQYMQVRRPSVVHDLYAGHSSGETTQLCVVGRQHTPPQDAPSFLSF